MVNSNFSVQCRRAVLDLEKHLRERTQQVPVRLNAKQIKEYSPRRSYIAGWRISITFSDEIIRDIDVLATEYFPAEQVRIALCDRSRFLIWPHVEEDGTLCLLPEIAEYDPDDPCAVAENLLNRAIQLVEELVDGNIIEQDFREEFLTYWGLKSHHNGSSIISILTPEPTSRHVRIWRGKNFEVVAEDDHSLCTWVRNRFGTSVDLKTEKAALIWLSDPPLPSEYPEFAKDLYSLANTSEQTGQAILSQLVSDEPDCVSVVVGSSCRSGPGLVAVEVTKPQSSRYGSKRSVDSVQKGFRKGSVPKDLIVNRYFGKDKVKRLNVKRADADWIHGRGHDARTEKLLDSTVIVVGCGSIGAPVACTLAQAGIGRIILVDDDEVDWPNIGRYPLGASAIGMKKTDALQKRLQTDYPHLQIESYSSRLLEFMQNKSELLTTANLIVSATGSWIADHALNKWHIENGRNKPILYCWTEPHACAGHAVAIFSEGGCFQCHIGSTGTPSLKVAEWTNGSGTCQVEPGCGDHYQPYGPVELSYVTAMISEVVLDCLLCAPTHSFARILAASQHRIEKLGGHLTNEWIDLKKNQANQGVIERPWIKTDCAVCSNHTLEQELV